MSRTNLTTLEVLELAVPCSYCNSPTGEWCGTTGGYWATWLHDARCWPILEGYRYGRDQGHREMADASFSTTNR